MNEPIPQRPRFTLMQLFVVVTVIGVLLGVSVPLIRRVREQGQQAMCASNQRQLALAIHIYHDTFDQLPPLATDPDQWTWIVLVHPYYEAGPNWPYSRLAITEPASSASNRSIVIGCNSRGLVCPARREQAKRDSGVYAGGQPSDYVAVSTSKALKWDADGDGMIVYRRSVANAPTPGNFFVQSATTFDSVTDGLTNTLMIGEKHMRSAWLGGPWDEPAFVASEDPNTIRVATDALGGKPLARSSEDGDEWLFGSWHEGITFFAFGDASVKPIAKRTDPSVLRQLSSRNDDAGYELE